MLKLTLNNKINNTMYKRRCEVTPIRRVRRLQRRKALELSTINITASKAAFI